jgi:serine/threonine protein phosphatase PrpC
MDRLKLMGALDKLVSQHLRTARRNLGQFPIERYQALVPQTSQARLADILRALDELTQDLEGLFADDLAYQESSFSPRAESPDGIPDLGESSRPAVPKVDTRGSLPAGVPLTSAVANQTYVTQKPVAPAPATPIPSRTQLAQKATTLPIAPSRPAPMKPIRLPNGNASREYAARIDAFLKVSADSLEFLQPWPEGMLQLNGVIQGTPVAAGEHVIPWRRRGAGTVEGEFHLTINADPRSLWKDLPSDQSDPFWKPDTDQRQSSSALACVAAGSVRGRSHAHVGSFRDDDFGMHLPPEQDPHGWHLLCVADGAGGSKSSRRGSQVACKVVIDKLREMLVEAPEGLSAELDLRSRDAAEQDKADGAFWARTLYHVMGTAAGHAQAAVRKEADAIGTSIKDFSTTLLVAIVRRTTQGAWFVGTYWVGDGAIGMWRQGWPAPKLFGEPETGEFAGQTTFFTSEDFGRAEVVHKRLRYTLVDDFDFLALMTDGISDAKFATEQLLKAPEPWAEFQADLGGVLVDLCKGAADVDAQLMRWMDFWSAGNHDDRTLLLMTPRRLEAGAI